MHGCWNMGDNSDKILIIRYNRRRRRRRRRRSGNPLLNYALNTFYYCCIGVVPMVNNYRDIETGNLLPALREFLFSIDRKGYFTRTVR